MKSEEFLAVQASKGRAATAVVCAVCLAASVLLLGISGTAAIAIVAWLRK